MEFELVGFLKALSILCPHEDGGLTFDVDELDTDLPLEKAVHSVLLNQGCETSELPSLEAVNPNNGVEEILIAFLQGAIPDIARINDLAKSWLHLIDELYSPYNSYINYEDFEYGNSLLLVIEAESKRLLIDCDWSYD